MTDDYSIPGEDTIRVLIVDDIEDTRENLRKLLAFEPDIEVVDRNGAGTGMQGIDLTRQHRPDVVLMDINMPDMDGITATKHIISEFPSTSVIIISVQSTGGYLRQAMLAGARDFLTKPISSEELYFTIRRVYAGSKPLRQQLEQLSGKTPSEQHGPATTASSARKSGHIIAVYSPTGGSGTTTIATNMAAALAQFQKNVLLVDADLQFGQVAMFLNLQPEYNIRDLLAEREVGEAALNRTIVSYQDKFKVLASPLDLALGKSGEPDNLPLLIQTLSQSYPLVVVDTPSSVLDQSTLDLFEIACSIILVITPTLPSALNVKRVTQFLASYPHLLKKIVFVINQARDKRGSNYLSVSRIENHLGLKVAIEIPLDETNAIVSINRAVPLVIHKRSPAKDALLGLAEMVQKTISTSDFVPIVLSPAKPGLRGLFGGGPVPSHAASTSETTDTHSFNAVERLTEPIKLLVADDNPVARENLINMLVSTDDCEVVGQAGSGREVMELLKRQRPHIILMDINMPDMDGLTATKQVVAQYPEIAVVIISVQGDASYMRMAAEAGAVNFLAKPISTDTLFQVVRQTYEDHCKAPLIAPVEKKPVIAQENDHIKPIIILDALAEYQTVCEQTLLLEYDRRLLFLVDRLARIASSAAHDIRGPLDDAQKIVKKLLHDTGSQAASLEKLSEYLEVALLETDSFLNISVLGSNDPIPTDVSRLVSRMPQLLKRLNIHNIQVHDHITSKVKVNRELLKLALFNLLVVGGRWSPDQQPVEIEASNEEIKISIPGDLSNGIDPRTLTLLGKANKADSLGTRLYVAHRTIRNLDGALDVDIQPGKIVFTIGYPEIKTWTSATLNTLRADTEAKQLAVTAVLDEIPSDQRDAQVEIPYTRIMVSFCDRMQRYLSGTLKFIDEVVGGYDAEIGKGLDTIKTNISYCSILISNFLDTVGRGGEIQLSQVKLTSVMEDTVKLLESKASEIDFLIDVLPLDAMLVTDETLLKRVLMNLARNAIDAAKRGGIIMLHGKQMGGTTHIEVVDSGSGIPEELQEKIFLHGFTTKRQKKGYGIGLHSVKTTVERLGGTVGFVTEPGEGTLFFIDLPTGG